MASPKLNIRSFNLYLDWNDRVKRGSGRRGDFAFIIYYLSGLREIYRSSTGANVVSGRRGVLLYINIHSILLYRSFFKSISASLPMGRLSHGDFQNSLSERTVVSGDLTTTERSEGGRDMIFTVKSPNKPSGASVCEGDK